MGPASSCNSFNGRCWDRRCKLSTEVSCDSDWPEIITTGGQHSSVDLEMLLVDGQHNVEQLALSSQLGQALKKSSTVARSWECTAQGAVLVSHAGNDTNPRHNQWVHGSYAVSQAWFGWEVTVCQLNDFCFVYTDICSVSFWIKKNTRKDFFFLFSYFSIRIS